MVPAATIRRRVSVPLRLPDGSATTALAVTFDGLVDGREHIAFGLGDRADPDVALATTALVRPHSECLTGDLFGSERCDCGPQLREALARIAAAGGWLLYLRQEGRGIGLYAKLDSYALQDGGLDTFAANVALGHGEDERDYTVAAQMLAALGETHVALLTNNPDKTEALAALGIDVTAVVPTAVHLTPANAAYLVAKARHGRHRLDLPSAAAG